MKGVKQHITSLLLIGIFMLPNALNIFHFVWVDHSSPKNFFSKDKINIQNQNQESHNCEQFFFKIPASDVPDLGYLKFSRKESFFEVISDRIHLVFYKEREENGLFLRGPPYCIFNLNNITYLI